jgi:hypothetical protein
MTEPLGSQGRFGSDAGGVARSCRCRCSRFMGGPTRRRIFGDRVRGAKASAELRARGLGKRSRGRQPEMLALVRANGGIWRDGAAVTVIGAVALPQKRRLPIVLHQYTWPAGSCRSIQHDCEDDRIASVIGNAIRSLAQRARSLDGLTSRRLVVAFGAIGDEPGSIPF